MDQIFQWLILFCGINNFHISGGAVVNPDRPFQLEHKQSNLFLNENLKFVESKQQAATFMLESYSSSRRTDRYIKEVKSGKVFDIRGGCNGRNVILYNKSGANNQLFFVYMTGAIQTFCDRYRYLTMDAERNLISEDADYSNKEKYYFKFIQ
ncbi:uncharacterized protein LOC132705353 isoform X2 [Cylas formicarius]|uniref:uncharacterized protein LOC132705353 isoform X2 n=1 Tax=Cylas formicarius TaxID=197179 RepID=UPI002958B25A|nr:uncharacterized protein LOC132705353 isoform X2 [Cylas formicarius]